MLLFLHYDITLGLFCKNVYYQVFLNTVQESPTADGAQSLDLNVGLPLDDKSHSSEPKSIPEGIPPSIMEKLVRLNDYIYVQYVL